MDQKRRQLLKHLAGLSALALPMNKALAAMPLRCSYGNDYAPWSWGSFDAVQGLAPDLIKALLGHVLNQNMSHQGYPWKRAQAVVEAGQADLLCTASTPDRLQYASASQLPVFKTSNHFYISKKSPQLKSLLQAKTSGELFALKPQFVTYLGSGWASQHLTGQRVHLSPNMITSLQMLASGHVDVMLENQLVTYHNGRQLKLLDHITASSITVEQINFHILIARTSPFIGLMAQIDAHIPEFLDSKTYKNILGKYQIEI